MELEQAVKRVVDGEPQGDAGHQGGRHVELDVQPAHQAQHEGDRQQVGKMASTASTRLRNARVSIKRIQIADQRTSSTEWR